MYRVLLCYLKNLFWNESCKTVSLLLFLSTFYLGRLSSVTTLKLNDNCLASLPFSIGGYCLFCILCILSIYKAIRIDVEACNIIKVVNVV